MTDEEITRALAEKVMGRPLVPFEPGEAWYDASGRYRNHLPPGWDPLLKDADACAVLDKMAADEWIIVLDKLPDTGWRCRFVRYRGGNEYAVDDCRRLAICVAALKAVGAWEEEQCIFCGAPMEVVGHTERFGDVLRCTARCIGGIGPGKAPKESARERSEGE